MAQARRPAPVAAPAPQGVNFGGDEFYSGGFTLPNGQYALAFDVRMHAGTKADGTPAGEPRLGVMVAAYPLAGGDPIEQFYSMGGKAALSFMPTPDGKGLSAIPGGPATSLNNSTNWNIFRKSLYDCALPQGIFTDSFTALDGIWVQTAQVDEPEGRKAFGAQTGETAEAQAQGPRKIAIVSEILEGGKPWEGTGGFDFAAAAAQKAAPKAGPARVAAPPARPVARPTAVAAPAQVAEAAGDEDELAAAAFNGIAEVLGEAKNAAGCTKLTLRVGTFKAIEKAAGAAQANAVVNTYFANDEALNGLLGQVGYGLVGGQVKSLA